MSIAKAIPCLVAAYRALLWLYPRELRGPYGCEMTAIFEQQLQAEWARRGTRGVLAISSCAIGEVMTIAIPDRVFSKHFLAPSASLLIAAALFAGLTAVLRDRALADWINCRFLLGGCH